MGLTFTIETEREEDGRWIAEVMEIPGAMVYGATIDEATAKVQALALRVLAERLKYGESIGMTTALDLGTIEKVDIRQVWPSEKMVNFTPWLGENLDKLGAELGLELDL